MNKRTIIKEVLLYIVIVGCMIMLMIGCSPFTSDPTRPDIRHKAKKDQQIRLNQTNPTTYHKNKKSSGTVVTIITH